MAQGLTAGRLTEGRAGARWSLARGLRLRVLAPALLLLAATAAPGALAQAQAPAPPKAEPSTPVPEVLEEAGRRLFEMLELLIKAIPQYEMPEVMPNGDIVIRRKPRAPDAQPPLPPGHDRT